jgi:hypothetical protein
MSETYFVTFANTDFMSTDRIVSQAKEFGIFRDIFAMNETCIPDFIEKHRNFIENNKDGYGFWIWKPKVIMTALERINDGDILVYCDAGMYLNKNGLPRFHQYINSMNLNERDMVTFSLNHIYKAQMFISASAIARYNPEFIHYPPSNYCYAGVMIIRKTSRTMRFISDWLTLCEDYKILCPVTTPYEHKSFLGGDSDNGIFNLLLLTNKISYTIYPDETNKYNPNGLQNYNNTDWSSLDNFPFQCRRIRPTKP